ncbi:UNVERIFIED_CONTAM: sugar phosphate permease [Brevibacillus sp. OAP136]
MWFAIYLTGFIGSLVLALYFSIMARQRGIHPLASRMTLGKMNMAIGVLFTLMALNQFTFEDLTGVRIGVALVLLLVGLVNLIFGTRNYIQYRRGWIMELKKNG